MSGFLLCCNAVGAIQGKSFGFMSPNNTEAFQNFVSARYATNVDESKKCTHKIAVQNILKMQSIHKYAGFSTHHDTLHPI